MSWQNEFRKKSNVSKVGFFTAVSFGDQPKSCTQSLLETVDSYFYLGGKKAYVVPGHAQQGSERTTLQNDSSTFLVTAIKVISYAILILPAIMLIAKVILRSIYVFHVIQVPRQDVLAHPQSNPMDTTNYLDAQQKLEEGIDISQDTIIKIQQLMPKILARADDEEITWHANSVNLVFSLRSIPKLIFKMANPSRIILHAGRLLYAQERSESRFANMVKGVKICTDNGLNLLVIPHAKQFNVNEMVLTAEEYIDINQNESAQEHLYQLSGLTETARQLAIFIAKTGFSDVAWRNMPLIDTAPEFQGNRRVALVDLEDMDGADKGIFGGSFGTRGLVGCLCSEEQIDIVLAEAQRQGIHSQDSSPDEVKARRMEELRSDQQLQEFYVRHGILENARKPIQIDDLTTLDLDLEERGTLTIEEHLRNGSDEKPSIEYREQLITLKEAVVDVIHQINDAITKTSENASIKGKRCILLNTNHSKSLQAYDIIGVPQHRFVMTEEERQQLWLRRIINALVAKGHLFKLKDVNGHGYFIQA